MNLDSTINNFITFGYYYNYETNELHRNKPSQSDPNKIDKVTYKAKKMLGEGGNAKVWSFAPTTNKGKTKALKIFKQATYHFSAKAEFEFLTNPLLKSKEGCLKAPKALIYGEGKPAIIVMPEYNGTLASRNWSSEEKVEIKRQLLIGLQSIHAAGRSHQDLKKENIFYRINQDNTISFAIADPVPLITNPKKLEILKKEDVKALEIILSSL